MAFQQVLGIGAIFWFKDLASKQVLNARKNIQLLKKDMDNLTTYQRLQLTRDIGTVQMAKGFKQLAVGAGMLTPALAGISAMKFDEKVLRTAFVLGEGVKGVEQLRNKILDIAQNSPFSAEDITSTLYELGSAGLSTAKSFQLLDSALWFGKVANIGYAESTFTIVKALNAFGWEVKDVDKVLDLMINLEQQSLVHYKDMPQFFSRVGKAVAETGVDPYTATILASELMGKGTERRLAGTRTASFFRSLSIMFGKKKVQEFFRESKEAGYKVELFDKEGNRLPLITQVQNLLTATKGMAIKKGMKGDQINAYITKVLNDIFGISASNIPTEFLNLKYQKGKEVLTGFDAFTQGLADLQQRGSFAERKRVTERLEIMKYEQALNQLKVAWIRLGVVVLPITVKLVQLLSKFSNSLNNLIKNHPTLIKTVSKIGLMVSSFIMLSGTLNIATGGFRILFALLSMGALHTGKFVNALLHLPTVLTALRTNITGLATNLNLWNGLVGGLIISVSSYIAILSARLRLAEQERLEAERTAKIAESRQLRAFNEKYGTTITDPAQFRALQAMYMAYQSGKSANLPEEQLRNRMRDTAYKSIKSYYQSELAGATPLEADKVYTKINETFRQLWSEQQAENIKKFFEKVENKVDVDVKVLIDGEEIRSAIVKADNKKNEAVGDVAKVEAMKNRLREHSPMMVYR